MNVRIGSRHIVEVGEISRGISVALPQRVRFRVVLLALLLLAAACSPDLQDSRCDPPEPHQCLYPLCCDPVCTNSANGCSPVGYQCQWPDSICTCGSDHGWHCQGSSPKDLAVHVVADMAQRASD